MRKNIRPVLAIGTAIVLLSGLTAGCSSSDSDESAAATAAATDAGTAAPTDAGTAAPTDAASESDMAAADYGSDGGYTYATDVPDHRLLVLDMCDINAQLDMDSIDFDAISSIYRDGGNAVKGDGSIRTIEGFAAAEGKNHNHDAYYGQVGAIDSFISEALAGEGMTEGESDEIRAQLIQKGIQNQALTAYVNHELVSALGKGSDGDFEGAVHNWDEGWAFYHGVDGTCGPYGTGDKRAENYATLESDGKTATANANILAAMIAGRDALLAENVEGATEAAGEVIRNLAVIYSQAVIRYATKMTSDLAEGDTEAARVHQAEGLAFWRVIEPIVGDVDKASTDAINTVFQLSNPPKSGTEGDVRKALEPIWMSLGISAEEVGTLQ